MLCPAWLDDDRASRRRSMAEKHWRRNIVYINTLHKRGGVGGGGEKSKPIGFLLLTKQVMDDVHLKGGNEVGHGDNCLFIDFHSRHAQTWPRGGGGGIDSTY
jgi:hypothetical protein